MKTMFGPDSRVAIVCRGGPENGPFSAMATKLIAESLIRKGIKLSAIYASSGSVPTALLGCTGDFMKLCNIWPNLGPEDIVGKVSKPRTLMRLLRRESILTSHVLRNLIQKNWNLDKIFASDAINIKFPAVDFLSAEYIIFSNKNPKHKRWFLEGVLGSMGLVPFLQPQIIDNPVAAELISADKVVKNAMLLIDGGFKGNMLLEEAMRDGFNIIFLVDIHGLKPTETDLTMRYHWPNLVRGGLHILSNANDVKQFQLTDRANEEIMVRDELVDFSTQLSAEQADGLNRIIDRMNNGRLRLGDKKKAEIIMVSNEEHSTLFNFAKFERAEVLELMSAGYEGAKRVLVDIGLETR
ncbi:MAG: hypothetical protein Q7S43_01225 [bacterium]|nr:hypothetical protein [bacterium]